MPKSIIDIDINDQSFKNFMALFQKYQTQLQAVTGLWGNVNTATTQAGATAAATTTATTAAVAATQQTAVTATTTAAAATTAATAATTAAQAAVAAAAAANNIAVTVNVAAQSAQNLTQAFAAGAFSAAQIFTAMNKVTAATHAAGAAAGSARNPFKQMEKSTKAVAGHIKDTTLYMAKWATLSLGAGLIGMGGSLWGIDTLANAVSRQRKSALGLGVTTAEQQAFNVNFGSRLVGGDFLSNVQGVKSDLGQQWQFSALGVPQSEIQSGDTAELGIDVIRRAQQLWQQAGPAGRNQQFMQAHGLSGFMDFATWQRIGQMSPQQMGAYEGQYRKDVGTMGAPDKVQTAWQDFSVQMQRAGDQIEAIFVKGLAPLIPNLTHLSESVEKALAGFLGNPHMKEWIDDIALGIEKLATYLGGQDFQDDIKLLLDGIAAVGHALKDFAIWLTGETPKRPDVPLLGGVGTLKHGHWSYAHIWPEWVPDDAGGASGGFSGDTLHPGSFTGGAARRSAAGYYNPPALDAGTAAEVAQRAAAVGINPSFMQSLAQAEGGTSTSSAGAIGTMQLMPGTAAEMGVDPTDPHQNIQGGVAYFKMLLERFGGNYAAAAAAYNAGPDGKGVDYFASTGDESQLPLETQRYIHTIQHLQQERGGKETAPSQHPGGDGGSVMQRLRAQAQRVTVNVNITNQTGAQVAVLANAVQQ